mmetsp:Transcript_8362/g.9984  ORF Transcript_8362/g.9984 Transcript_8362/m.9984 type:complete len:463 (+) Transcript_8362:90-1478(+)
MSLHKINGKQISDRNDNLDDYELQRQELVRLLRSAESEDKRKTLEHSLSQLESRKQVQIQQTQIQSEGNQIIRGSARSLTSTSQDDDVSSDDGEDEPLGYFSSPGSSKIPSNRSPNSRNNNNNFGSGGGDDDHGLEGAGDASSHSVPRINLSEASLSGNRNLNPNVPSIDHDSNSLNHTAVLANMSPDLTDAPLSGRKSVPNSARPASARWKGTLELRTIPEFSPFNRPLSGANKKPGDPSSPTEPKAEINNSLNGSGSSSSSRSNDLMVALSIYDGHELMTPLIAASKNGHSKVVKRLLLEPHILVDQMNVHGETALMYAAGRGDLDCALSLMQSGADSKLTDQTGASCIHWALRGQGFGSMISLLAASTFSSLLRLTQSSSIYNNQDDDQDEQLTSSSSSALISSSLGRGEGGGGVNNNNNHHQNEIISSNQTTTQRGLKKKRDKKLRPLMRPNPSRDIV